MTSVDGIVLESNADQECAQFQASMADRISKGEDLQDHPHMLTCERCTALVRELETIAEVARMLMPTDSEPRDDLWMKIEGKLAIESNIDAESLFSEGKAEPETEENGSRDGIGTLDGMDKFATEGGIA